VADTGQNGDRGTHRSGVIDTDSVPTVIVDDVHLIYRIAGRHSRRNAPAALFGILKRGKSPGMREVHAVRGVSFTAYRGEAIGLIGPNGSGKSTLLRGIAGLMAPHSGAIYTSGQPSLLGVGAAMMEEMSGERNVVLGCLAMGMTPDEVKAVYDDIVDFAGIGDFISLPMNTYSSGMGARLRFAIAAARTHEVLLIDEALATGDAEFRRKSEQRIHNLREQAGTVFLVSHGLGVIRETCNRAIWLEKGKIVLDGEANAVVDAYQDRHDPEARAEAAAAATGQGPGKRPLVFDEASSI
jgi:teichoic acid transport system ATP-binding protein